MTKTDGYNFFGLDRNNKYGGVLVYVKSILKASLIQTILKGGLKNI